MGLLLFALYACSHYGASSPILRPREDQTSTWQSEPTGRGTWGLLSSCMITMGICVWSAVHLNVPGRPPQRKLERLSFSEWWDLSFKNKWKGWRYWSHQLRRTRWTIMGLLAPELVVYCAWVQWSDARELSKRIRKAQYSPNHPWTLSHSFFAGMGGFAVNCSDFMPGQDLLYLTTAGAQRIVELGHQLPDLHEEAIEDKSKADSLGKILVCLQAGYVIFQVIGRLTAHLPITLLEVNTLGHVLCAFTMYAFWFRKPLGVRDPIMLSDDLAKPLMCLWAMRHGEQMYMRDYSSPMNRAHPYRELDRFYLFAHPELREQVDTQFPATRSLQAQTQPELSPSTEKIEPVAASHNSRNSAVLNVERNTPIRAPPVIQRDLPENLDGLSEHCVLFHKDLDSPTGLTNEEIQHRLQESKLWDGLTHVYHCGGDEKFERWWAQWSTQIVPEVELRPGFGIDKPVSPFTGNGISVFIPRHIFLDSAGLRQWGLAYRGLELDPNGPMFIAALSETRWSDSLTRDTLLVTRRMNNWPSKKTGLLSNSDTPVLIMAFITALYGALHALCWHSHFPSVAEKMLWRTASIIIAGGPVTVIAFLAPFIYVSDMRDTIWDLLCVITLVLCAVSYVGARLFILLEAFISLRDLPAAAYQTPNWTPWLPHL